MQVSYWWLLDVYIDWDNQCMLYFSCPRAHACNTCIVLIQSSSSFSFTLPTLPLFRSKGLLVKWPCNFHSVSFTDKTRELLGNAHPPVCTLASVTVYCKAPCGYSARVKCETTTLLITLSHGKKNETSPWQLSPNHSSSCTGKARFLGKCVHSLTAKPLQTLVILSVLLKRKEKLRG